MSTAQQTTEEAMSLEEFLSIVASVYELYTEAFSELARLAAEAVESGWTSQFASIVGIARTTVYDWATAAKTFGRLDPAVPLWLQVGAARAAKGNPGVAQKILELCIAGGMKPTQLIQMMRGRPIKLTGVATVKYGPNFITLYDTSVPTAPRPNLVQYTLVSREPDSPGTAQPDIARQLEELISRLQGQGNNNGEGEDKDALES